MAFNIRYDKTLDTQGGSNFDGTAGNFYSEEFVLGPSSSRKFERFLIGGPGSTGDEDISAINFSDITDISEGIDVKFTGNGVEASKIVFDGLRFASQFRVTFDYNLVDGWIFNSIVDGVTYRTISNPETWTGMTFKEIFDHLLNTAAPGSNIVFEAGGVDGWDAAAGAEDRYAGEFSFRNEQLPQAIDQIVKRVGNLIWFVESEAGQWKLRFKKRDLSGATAKLAKVNITDAAGIPSALNVIGLDIKGPATLAPDAARIVDEGRGWKYQVGGPLWRGGAETITNPHGTVAPLEFQLEFFSPQQGGTTDFKRYLNAAISLAALNNGYGPGADYHHNYGWSNIKATIGNLNPNAPINVDVKKEGYHYLPLPSTSKRSTEVNTNPFDLSHPLPIDMVVPIINDRLTRGAPDKPDKLDGSGPVDDPWRIDGTLLTHPDAAPILEVRSSPTPTVIDTQYFDNNVDQADDIADHISKMQERIDAFALGELAHGRTVAKGFVEQFDYQSDPDDATIMGTAVAIIACYYPTTDATTVDYKIDTLGANLVVTYSHPLGFPGDWSAVARNTVGSSLEGGILEWVTDGSKYTGASEQRPFPKLFIRLEQAFETNWEQKFILHCVLTVGMPAVIEPPGTPTGQVITEQGDYEKHNVVFNIADVAGYPVPKNPDGTDATPRDDTARMQQRASILQEQTDPSKNVKGQFTIFPGDNTNVKLGVFTNGGIIAKIRHDYAPYFKTTFWLESADDVRELAESEPREVIKELRTLVSIQKDKIKAIERSIFSSTDPIIDKYSRNLDKFSSSGIKGSDEQTLTAGLLVDSISRVNTEDTTLANSPNLDAKGYGKQGRVNLDYDKTRGSFFSGGLQVDPDPELNAQDAPLFARSKNLSSPIVVSNDRGNPASDQKVGFANNFLDLVKSSSDTGFNGGERFRTVLNVRREDIAQPTLLDKALDNYGGDRLNIADMEFNDGGSLSLVREGELSAYTTNNIFFTRRVSGSANLLNSVHFGISRETRTGSAPVFIDGAMMGINKTVGATLNYQFGLNLSVKDTDNSNFCRDYVSGIPHRQGLFFGPHQVFPDLATGKNYQWFLRMDSEEAGVGSPFTHTFERFSLLQTAVKIHSTVESMGLLTRLALMGATDMVAGTDYTVQVAHSFPANFQDAQGRAFEMRHETINAGLPEKRPQWTVTHGSPPIVPQDTRILLTEGSTNLDNISGGRSFTFPTGTQVPVFKVQAGPVLQMGGDAGKDIFMVHSRNGVFAIGQTINRAGAQTNLFKVNTDGEYKELVHRLSAEVIDSQGVPSGDISTTDESLLGGGPDDIIVKLLDTNDDMIRGFKFNIAGADLTWPPNQIVDGSNTQFVPETGTGAKTNKNPKIYTDDDEWVALGIGMPGFAADPGPPARLSFDTSVIQTTIVDLFGNMTQATPNSTIEAVDHILTNLINAHNALIFNLREFERRQGRISAAIWGSEDVDAIGTADVHFDRHLKMLTSEIGGTLPPGGAPASPFGIMSDEDRIFLGNLTSAQFDDAGLHIKSNGISLLIGTGETTIGTSLVNVRDAFNQGLRVGAFTSHYSSGGGGAGALWIGGVSTNTGIVYGLSCNASANRVPSGITANTTKRLPFGITSTVAEEVDPQTQEVISRDVRVCLTDIDGNEIPDVTTTTGCTSFNIPNDPSVQWPPDATVNGLTDFTFVPPTPGNVNRNQHIYTDDDEWRTVGIGMPGFGLANSAFDTTDIQTTKPELFGDMTNITPHSTIEALEELLFNVIEAHNKLVFNLREFEVKQGTMAAAIWGGEQSTTTPANRVFDRHLNLLSGFVGGGEADPGGGPKTPWWINSNNNRLFVGKTTTQALSAEYGLSVDSGGFTWLGGSVSGTVITASDVALDGATLLNSTLTWHQGIGSGDSGLGQWRAGVNQNGFLRYGLALNHVSKKVPSGVVSGSFRAIPFHIDSSVSISTAIQRADVTIELLDIDLQSIAPNGSTSFSIPLAVVPIDRDPPEPPGGPGVQGPRGPAGPAGPAGQPGRDGVDGDTGTIGETGPTGPTGTIGSTGLTGPTGPTGDDGPVGPQGPAGADGDDGPEGPRGIQGATGPAGPEGQTIVIREPPPPPPGAGGLTGPRGPGPPAPAEPKTPVTPRPETGGEEEGDTGPTGPRGPTGDDGPEGPIGPTGAEGPQGPGGPAGECECTPGEILPLLDPFAYVDPIEGDDTDPDRGIEHATANPLINPDGNNYRLLIDQDRNREYITITELRGSYETTDGLDFIIATSSNPDKTFENITNATVLQIDGANTSLLEGSDPQLRDKDGNRLGNSSGEPDALAATAGFIQTLKGPVNLDTLLDENIVRGRVGASSPRLSISAIRRGLLFGGGGGVANPPLNIVSNHPSAPSVDPRSDSYDDTRFIRSTLRLGMHPPGVFPDATGRWYISAGNYAFPTSTDFAGRVDINSNADARVAYGGIAGIGIGSLVDIIGLEMLPHNIVSRRAFGVMGTVTRVTAAGGGETTQDVIVNNYGIHGAIQEDDGEFDDTYVYDSGVTPGSIVWGGEIGKLRTQINRSDGLVATGNSGLWIGGLEIVNEGDSIEEAIIKVEDRAARTGGMQGNVLWNGSGDEWTSDEIDISDFGATIRPQVMVSASHDGADEQEAIAVVDFSTLNKVIIKSNVFDNTVNYTIDVAHAQVFTL